MNTIILLTTGLGLVVMGMLASQEDTELQAIEEVLNDYMIGGTERDAPRQSGAFHPQAMMKFKRDGVYTEVNAAEFFGAGKPGPNLERTTDVVFIDVSGDVAVAKLHLTYAERRFVDYMTLMKVDGHWKIINKTFHIEQFNNTQN